MTMIAKDINGNEIKVGDMVERVEGFNGGMVVGDRGIVKNITERLSISWLTIEGFNKWHDASRCKKIQSFTKSDLKDGMVVTYRNGWIRFVSGGGLYKIAKDFVDLGSSLEYYNNSLEHDNDEDMDIVKVFSVSDLENPIWEREEPLTEEQLRIKELEEGIANMQEELNKLL